MKPTKVMLVLLAILILSCTLLNAQTRGYAVGMVIVDDPVSGTSTMLAGVTVNIYLINAFSLIPPHLVGSPITDQGGEFYYYINPLYFPIPDWVRVRIEVEYDGQIYSLEQPYSYGNMVLNLNYSSVNQQAIG